MEQQTDSNLLHLVRNNLESTPTLKYQLQIDDIIIEIEHLLKGDSFDEINEFVQQIRHTLGFTNINFKKIFDRLKGFAEQKGKIRLNNCYLDASVVKSKRGANDSAATPANTELRG